MFNCSLVKAYAVAALILILCLMPSSSLPSVSVDWLSLDKVVHLIMYVPLAWTLVYGFKLQKRFPLLQRYAFVFGFIFSSLYGAFIEMLQMTITPDRSAEFFDFVADVAGAALGLLTYTWGAKLIDVWSNFWKKRGYEC